MTYIEAKQKLHEYIEHASEDEVMELMSFVEPHEPGGSGYVFDEAALNILRERSEEYRSGKAKTYSLEEAMRIIKSQTNIDGI